MNSSSINGSLTLFPQESYGFYQRFLNLNFPRIMDSLEPSTHSSTHKIKVFHPVDLMHQNQQHHQKIKDLVLMDVYLMVVNQMIKDQQKVNSSPINFLNPKELQTHLTPKNRRLTHLRLVCPQNLYII